MDQSISDAYSNLINTIENTNATVDQYNKAVGVLLDIRNGLIPNGSTFTTTKNNVEFLALGAKTAEELKYGKLSNALGRLGEEMSSLSGAAIAGALLDEVKESFKNHDITFSANYENVGAKRQGTYRNQTDNKLTISFKLNPKAGSGEKAGELNFNFNISDKANKQLSNMSKKRKATGSLTFRSSTVANTTKDLDKKAVYNTISYHRTGKYKFSIMNSDIGQSLRRYIGYKMLIDMLIGSRNHEDEIDFTVYGNKIIPENRVVEKLLSAKNQNYQRYMAEVEYWQLRSATNTKEAEEMIPKLSTRIKESISF